MAATASVREYLEAVQGVLSAQDGYVATVLVGSLASNDFEPASSDLDLISLFRSPLSRKTKERLISGLTHRAIPCPAHGLDLVAYVQAETVEPSSGLTYEFSLWSGLTLQDDLSFGGPYPGGLIDLAAARHFGSVLEGGPTGSLIGPVDADLLRVELRRSLDWHLHRIHDPFHDPLGANAVLNACRAVHFLRWGNLVSKTRGAAGFRRGPHADLVRAALAARRSPAAVPLPRDRVSAFLAGALKEFGEGR